MRDPFPANLRGLHSAEEQLRAKALEIVAEDGLTLHLEVAERVMDLLDILRQFENADEDYKVLQALGIRLFNGLGAMIKLCLSGYSQAAALLLRDILETSFLLDLLGTDRSRIEGWRLADRRSRNQNFSALRVREQLDQRDGFTTQKRAEHYRLLSELAGHASMESLAMLRPRGMDIQIGPFIDDSAVEAVLAEMGRIAFHLGDIVASIMPPNWSRPEAAMISYRLKRLDWITTFYSGGPEAPDTTVGEQG